MPNETRWMRDHLMDIIKDTLRWPVEVYHRLRCAFLCRFVDRTHTLPTDLKKGHFYELDERILHALFTALVDFVEVEYAHMWLICHEKTDAPLWARVPWLRWWRWRSPEYGIRYLEWEATLDNPNLPEGERMPEQAATAREILSLYHWWKYVRPHRPDPWSTIDAEFTLSSPFPSQREALKAAEAQESAQIAEDDEMLSRLIRIRRSLWT